MIHNAQENNKNIKKTIQSSEKQKKGQKNKWKIAQRKHIISVSGQTKSQVRELNI